MKKNLYRIGLSNRLNGQWSRISMKLLGLVVATFFMAANTLMAQTWIGGENSNFTYEQNWDPAGDVTGKNLVITTSDNFIHHPVVTGTSSISINSLNISVAADPALQATLTINFDNAEAEFSIATGWDRGADYGFTGIIVQNGVFRYTRSNAPRLDGNSCFFRMEGGKAIFGNPILMGNGNNPTAGGKIFISGGVVEVGAFGRMYMGREDGQVEITGDGKLIVNGDFPQSNVDNGWINGGENFSIIRTYDAVANKTTFEAVSNEAFLVLNSDRQVLVAGQEGTPVLMLNTTRVQEALSLEWKYREAGQENYTSFAPAKTGATFVPQFVSSGTYFVRCEGVDKDGVELNTGDVEFYVGSDKITIAPYSEIQYARIGRPLYELSATVDGNYSGFEWKYSPTPGGPYLSFDPAATDLTTNPTFGAGGNYYVVAEAMIDGVFNRSTELWYVVENISGRDMEWHGNVSSDLSYPGNYNPVSTIQFANLFFRVGSTNEAILSTAVNDTLNRMYVYDTKVILDKGEESVLNIRNEMYNEGMTIINSGIVDVTAQFFRVPAEADTVVVQGNAVLKARNVLVGNSGTPTTGGTIFLKENAKAYFEYIDRVHTGKDSTSRVWIDDKAVLFLLGDQTSRAKSLIEAGKIVSAKEFFEPYMMYDKSIGYTFVRALDTRVFALADAKKQYTGAGEAIATPLTLINGDGLTTFSWYSSSNPTGPWTMIDGSTDTPSLTPSFAESGTYFVIAIGSDGSEEFETSNVATIEVVGLSISPDELEMLPGQGSEMNYILSEGTSLVARAWWNLTDEENAVVLSNDSTFIPSFTELGTYIIGFQAEVKDEYNNIYFLSARATVKVVDELTSIGDVKKARVSVYPNPSTGTFSVDAEGSYSVEVYDLTGKLVLRQDASQGQQPITLAQKGVFLVKVLAGKDVQVTRVVIK